METADDACRTGKAMLGALMERKAQRGTNRACSGMIATVALPHTVQGLRRWSEHLGGVWDGEVIQKLQKKLRFPFELFKKMCIFIVKAIAYQQLDDLLRSKMIEHCFLNNSKKIF